MTDETDKSANEEPKASTEEKPAETPVEKPAEAAPPAPSSAPTQTPKVAAPRRSVFSIAGETIRYIERAEKDKTLHVRTNDKKSVVCMALSFLIGIGFTIMYMVNDSTRSICIALALVADFLLGFSILWYVLLRFGVLRTVEPRHALLCWQLMLGAGVLFSFYTMNIAFAFFTIYSTTHPAAATAGTSAGF